MEAPGSLTSRGIWSHFMAGVQPRKDNDAGRIRDAPGRVPQFAALANSSSRRTTPFDRQQFARHLDGPGEFETGGPQESGNDEPFFISWRRHASAGLTRRCAETNQ